MEKEDLQALGERARDTIRNRVQLNLKGVRGQAPPPLSPGYRKRKQKKYGKSVRNLSATMKLWEQFRVWGASRTKVMIGWKAAYGKRLVEIQSRRYDFLWISKTDNEEIIKLLQELVEKRLKKLKLFK